MLYQNVPLYILQNIHWKYGMQEERPNIAHWGCRIVLRLTSSLRAEIFHGNSGKLTPHGSVDYVNLRLGLCSLEDQEEHEKGEVLEIPI